MRLANKVAVITGASSGIGRSIAYVFAKEGAKIVAVADMNIAGGEETVVTIKTNGGEAVFIRADVTVASDVEQLVKVTIDKYGKIDILVNSAGKLMKPALIEDVDELAWDQIYAVNVKGIFLTAKYVVPQMKKAAGGVIVNIASIAGTSPRQRSAAYASSKGAVITLTKALAMDLAPDIRVNCINPTVVETPMAEQIPKELKERLLSVIPLGRLAKSEDVAYAALYLACDESSMLTGTCINVDGGRSI